MNEQEQKELEEFKLGVKDYLDKTDQLFEILKKGYDELHSTNNTILMALQLINDKVNIIATAQGLMEAKTEEVN